MRRSLLLAAALGLMAAGRAGAGIISPGDYLATGAGSGAAFVISPAPNNNDTTEPSPNILTINKTSTGVGPLDFVFPVLASGGTTEYAVSEGDTNNTGTTWTGLTFRLGTGTGAGFVPLTAGAMDFDAPNYTPTPTSLDFATLTPSPYALGWSGGAVPPDALTGFTYSFGLPDGLTSFTLRGVPTAAAVPEPSALPLLVGGLALVVLAAARPRRAAP